MLSSGTLVNALALLLMQGNRPGVLLIDMDEPSMDNPENELMISNEENLLQAAVKAELPILDIILHGANTIERLRHVIKQSKNYINYRKNMESAFDEDNIKLNINNQRMSICQYFQSIDCNHLFIMGYADDDCVFETVFDALALGFSVYADRAFNLGADYDSLGPWDSVIGNPNMNLYIPTSQKRVNRTHRVFNMKLFGS